MTTTLIIPDTHAPFQHLKTIEILKEAKKEFKPDFVVHVGDIIDSHNISGWDSDPDIAGVLEEFEGASEFCQELGELFPKLKVCYGNHDLRFIKKMKGVGVPSMFFKTLEEALDTPKGWEWSDHFLVPDHKYGSTYITHGDGFSGPKAALDAALSFRLNTVIGHVHAYAGVAYTKSATSQLWGMNVGCLIDDKALAFAYGKLHKQKPINAFGIVKNGVPHIVPV